MIKLREFQLSDLDRILEISRSSFAQPWPKSEFEKWYKKGFFVAEENKKVVGFIVGRVSDKAGVIKSIAVEPVYRGKGIGEDLLYHILKYFESFEIKEVLARVRTKNKAGIDFLKNFGFEITETIEKYYPDGEDAYLMKKKI